MQKAVNFTRSLSTLSRKVSWAPFHPDLETFEPSRSTYRSSASSRPIFFRGRRPIFSTGNVDGVAWLVRSFIMCAVVHRLLVSKAVSIFFFLKLRPLFFISLFLVTRVRSFRQELKPKKKSATGVEQRSSIWTEHDRACQQQGFIEVPVCTSRCEPSMLCEGVRVRTRGQQQMRTWLVLPDYVTDLAWTLRCV